MSDQKAAAIHRARAEQALLDAMRFDKIGLTRSAASARQFARSEDDTAYMLEHDRKPRRATS